MASDVTRVCVVGSGTRFLSGISYYTIRVANALAQSYNVSVITMRQLLPTALYPGRARVGANLTRLHYGSRVRVLDGVDWYWLPTIVRAIAWLVRERPQVIVFQWWTATVLHSYLVLACVARLLGARVVVEFHEVLDTGEAKLRLVRLYVRLLAPRLMTLAEGFVIHSEDDRLRLQAQYKLGQRPVAVIPHGPYDHYRLADVRRRERPAPPSSCNLLFFGIIRPYKGLEDLIAAFDAIPENAIDQFWLTIVGETWENWTLPADRMAASRYRSRITFVNRYVTDEEVAQFFAAADAAVLPYHRSSASGPLHVAMSYGLPVVITSVGGLPEAVADYEGAIMVPPHDPEALSKALVQVVALRGKRFRNPHSWDERVERYRKLFAELVGGA